MELKNVVNHYKTLLTGEKFYVTGSLAMAYIGLCEFNVVNDLDIVIVNPTDECVNILNRLVEEHPSKITSSPGSKLRMFMHDKTKIDVFLVKETSRTIPSGDGFDISTIECIVKAKKSYNRLKDWTQLWNIGQKFCTHEELMTAVSKCK